MMFFLFICLFSTNESLYYEKDFVTFDELKLAMWIWE